MTAPGPALRERLLACGALAAAVGCGIVSLALGGAPASYSAVNAAALGLAALAVLVPGQRHAAWPGTLVLLAAPVLLATTLLAGPEILGVHRWIAAGPLKLHAGMLLVPALVAVVATRRDWACFAALALCALLAWRQPDFATALALACGLIFATAGRPLQPVERAMRLVTAVAMVLTSFQPDPLQPVRFVETALADGMQISPALGLAMALSLALALVLPPWLLARSDPERQRAARGIIGAMVGFTLPSLLSAYPQPLVGYGASSILGYGIAIAVLRFSR